MVLRRLKLPRIDALDLRPRAGREAATAQSACWRCLRPVAFSGPPNLCPRCRTVRSLAAALDRSEERVEGALRAVCPELWCGSAEARPPEVRR